MSESTHPGRFSQATAVRRTADGYDSTIAEGWDIAGNANGGYLLALLTRALRDAGDKPDAVSVTAHYLSPGKAGPVTIQPSVLKTGKTFTTVSGGMYRDDRILLHATGTFGDLSDRDQSLQRVDGTPPELPPADDCVRTDASVGFAPAIMHNIDLRLHPEDSGFAVGSPSGVARVRGWFRLLDDEPIDSISLLLATDAFPPTAFNAALPVGWVPTVELTAHVRARPEPGWLRCEFTSRFVTGGFLEEDGLIWDDSGRLVAQSRQLALLPRSS